MSHFSLLDRACVLTFMSTQAELNLTPFADLRFGHSLGGLCKPQDRDPPSLQFICKAVEALEHMVTFGVFYDLKFTAILRLFGNPCAQLVFMLSKRSLLIPISP